MTFVEDVVEKYYGGKPPQKFNFFKACFLTGFALKHALKN